jgi:hypothetical protein
MHKEMLVARLLDGRLSMPTPRILLADDSKALTDFNFAAMTRLKGQNVLGLERGSTDPRSSRSTSRWATSCARSIASRWRRSAISAPTAW